MKGNNKKRITVTKITLLFVVFTIGITYAFIIQTLTGTKEVVINAGVLDLVLEEENAITISNALPMHDAVGMIQEDVFVFRLVNKTSNPTNYVLKLQEIETGTLDKSIVKYGLIKEGEKTIDLVSNIIDGVIDEGRISGNDTINYELRLWIDSSVTEIAQVEKKFLSFKVSVSASQKIAKEENKCVTAVNGEDTSNAETPRLTSGMIPVVYDECEKTWLKADTTESWYNYDTQNWANAVTVTEDTRDTYVAMDVGEPISIDDINTMWVWIPRYEYQYTNLGNQYAGGTQAQPGEIKINFISRNTTSPSDSNTYRIPEGFKFGDENIPGFWMGKFETTGEITETCTSESCTTIDLTVIPNQYPVVNQNLSSFFYASRSMQNSSNADKYGFDEIGNGTMDVHMLKNTEWGIVAMLSQSKYGKYGNSAYTGVNKEVYVNESTYITGNSNGTPSQVGVNTQVTYDTPDTGYGASTTGTIYGVYDMSGGAYEYMMGNYNKNSGASINSNSGFDGYNGRDGSTTDGVEWPDEKYYDLYTTDNAAIGYKYGDATYETSGWYDDANYFVKSGMPWFVRSNGSKDDTVYSGVFFFDNYYMGWADEMFGMRLCIKP